MPVKFERATLPNGLNIIAEVDPAAHSAGIGFFVKTGARDEDPADMGVSHFLEHMMFKGTETRSAEDVDRDFDDIGADHNAFTTNEMTAFWAHSLPEHLPAAEEVLADILRPALRDQDFADEKSVIIEEIAMYEDQPFWVLYERTMETYFGAHPLGHRVLGTRATIEPMAGDSMRAYFHERYSADNTVIAMAGSLDFEDMTRRIDGHCSGWQTTQTQRQYPSAPVNDQSFTIESSKVNRHYEIILTAAPALGDERRYAAGMLAQILGDADGSRLYWALIETGLAEEARVELDAHDGVGQFVTFFVCDPVDAEAVQQAALAEIAGVVESLTDDDLVRHRSKIATGATLQGELPAGRMQRLGRVWTYLGEYRSLEEELARIEAVTLDGIREVYEAFPFTPRVIGCMRPE